MSTTDSALLRELFEAVADLDPATRANYLDAHCPARLRARLDVLLRADADAGEPVSRTRVGELAGNIGDMPAVAPRPSHRIGPFEVLGLLGEGGFSTVLHARREVAGATQDVALKLLRRSLHSPEARQQFRREQRALLALHHPNIARMIEGGVTGEGQPYIALELVRGSDIVEHARQRNLDLRARLRLFVVACRAVDAAHRALIVHRDLKPSNVLVDDEGEVKLLDFGIAKLLEGDDEDHRTLMPAFTPAYAAPEQRSGGAVTTATDVYALGVLLGELLTGERVNDGSGRTPSSRVGMTAGDGAVVPITRRQLRGDLDTIVMKALADEPERRYASAGTLADDIERLLEGRPVTAHPPSTWYRARKFVMRHKGGVASTFAFLVAILAALGVALWQAHVARGEAIRANTQTQRAESVRDFLVSVFDAAQPEVP
ncbi:MAG TPA: serine/threonine-protein kinase, partial [Dokdonella sp.]|nr:serine/threonine-protein kinase [Dokdonella sp.]